MQQEAYPKTLPNEVWLSVAGFSTQNSLRNLCLVSKRFCALMQPVLFRHYVQPGYPDGNSLEPFMRACIARPDLAAAVKKATIHDWDTREDDTSRNESRRRKRKHSDWRYKHDLELQRLRSDLGITIDDLFNVRNFPVFCSLIPNIEHLILDVPPIAGGCEYQFGNPFLLRPKLRRPTLSKLRQLQLDFSCEEEGFDLREYGILIAVRSLKTLRGHHVCGDEQWEDSNGSPGLILKDQRLSIQHINLMCSVMTHRCLKELIERCDTLKTFEIVYGEVTTGAITEFDFDVVSSAFLAHKASLESLILDFEGETATELLDFNDVEGVMKMSSFECLRHIDLPAWGMLRRDRHDNGDGEFGVKSISNLLPRSLESLVVRSCKRDTVASLWGLLSALDTLPNLKEIAFSGEREADLEGLDGFDQACKEKGICLNSEK